jgi:hypothetical protein
MEDPDFAQTIWSLIIIIIIEGPRSRSYGRTAALKAYFATLGGR